MRLGVTPADLHALARLIRRYESGLYPEGQLAGRLREVLDGLRELLVKWRPRLRGLRHRPAAALRDCDDAISNALRLCAGRQFKPCLLQLRRARGELTRLQEMLDAHDEHARAAEAFRELTTLLDARPLCQLPTIETIARLLDESDDMLASGRSRQAVFIARLCRHKALALTEAPEAGRESVQELSARLGRQAEFFRRTRAFAPSPDDLKLRRALERLPELLAQRRVALVARLTADIEYEMGSRRAVLASLGHTAASQRESGGAGNPVEDVLKRIVREESWEQAANYALRRALSALSAETAALRPAIERVSRQMEGVRPQTDAVDAAAGVN